MSRSSYPRSSARRSLPQYQLILANNAKLALMFVVQSLTDLLRFGREEAERKMWETHHSGQTTLLVTHLELAEHYVELLSERGLKVAMHRVG